jgi:hypothetical protein
MRGHFRVSLCVVALSTTVFGCDGKDAKPRGAGASGQSLAVLAKPQIDMEKFFTYSPEQEKVIALMNRPFAEAVKETGAAKDEDAKHVFDKVKAGWDGLPIIRKKEGIRIRYRLQFDTTAGELVMDFFEGFTPDVVRNLVARANAKALDGLQITLENDSLVFGPPLEKNAYTVQARPVEAPMPKGTVYAFLVGDRSAGDRFGIALKRQPEGGSKVSMFGRIINPSVDTLFGELIEKLKRDPKAVMIKSVQTKTFDTPIFQGMDVLLPKLTKAGELEVPDLPMYTGASASRIYGKGHEGHSHDDDSILDGDLGGANPSKNPNVPKKPAMPAKSNAP